MVRRDAAMTEWRVGQPSGAFGLHRSGWARTRSVRSSPGRPKSRTPFGMPRLWRDQGANSRMATAKDMAKPERTEFNRVMGAVIALKLTTIETSSAPKPRTSRPLAWQEGAADRVLGRPTKGHCARNTKHCGLGRFFRSSSDLSRNENNREFTPRLPRRHGPAAEARRVRAARQSPFATLRVA